VKIQGTQKRHEAQTKSFIAATPQLLVGEGLKSFPPFRLDEINQCLWKGHERISLSPKPFSVLQYLVAHPGRLITHDELLNAIWKDIYVQPEVLRRYILEIRRVLGDQASEPGFIETLPKRGYQFIASVSDSVEVELEAQGTHGAERTKLVGRESALRGLESYLENALKGQRQVVFVSGEAGIGKTRLVDGFTERAQGIYGVRVVTGQSVEGYGGKEAYYPIFEALGRLARGTSGPAVVDILAKHAPTWIIQLPALVDSERFAALQQQALGATRDRMVRELCQALEVMTATDALVLVLEDLHWVDQSTVDLISAIARRRDSAKLLMLGTFRPADLIVSESPFKTLKHDLLLHHLCSDISLERLNESEVTEYLAAQYGDGDLPRKLSTVIHKHSDGNPLFMIAMLDHLASEGVLERDDDGGWTITVPPENIHPGVPETLKQMLEVQLQHSSDAEYQLLKCASVAGQQFTAWAVATMMERDPTEVEEQCSASAERLQFLNACGLVELASGTLTLEYEFLHSLYRDVLYRHLGPSQRVKYHLLLAEALEHLRPSVEPDVAAELALHFEEGQDYERAIRYWILAAENSTRRYAHRESIATLEHALQLLPMIGADKVSALDVQLLEKLGDAQYAIGEMERSAATYHAMATHAAEAGLLTAQANALMHLAHSAEAIPFFQKAVELDPNFASAYVSLSRIYSNLGDVERAKEYAKLAYQRCEHVGERERLSIIYQYNYEVTGDQALATQALKKWKLLYPEEFQPPNSLAYLYNILGAFEQAIEEAQEALRRNPSHGFPYSNLAHAYRGAGLYEDARKTAEQAVALNIETVPTRRLLYQLAILFEDQALATQHVEWGRDRPREFEIVGARAQVAAHGGRTREARHLYEETAEMAEFRNLAAVGTNHLAWASWMELAYGNKEKALSEARRVLSREPSYDPRLRAALTLSMCGFTTDAASIADELELNHSEHTIIRSILVPIVRAGIALANNVPAQAVKELWLVAPYEFGFIAAFAPAYLRGQAYLMEGSGEKAVEEFERIIEHRGTDPFSPFHAIAPLGLARAYSILGKKNEAIKYYESFLANWAGADSDIPLLVEARKEYNKC
jgi:DNA-binding winged helix-turn-helix (wHTH) protein/tetratricopeptide (TPR) repeat protein